MQFSFFECFWLCSYSFKFFRIIYLCSYSFFLPELILHKYSVEGNMQRGRWDDIDRGRQREKAGRCFFVDVFDVLVFRFLRNLKGVQGTLRGYQGSGDVYVNSLLHTCASRVMPISPWL